MSIKDAANKDFARPTEPPQRRHDDRPNVEARARGEAERKTETAIDQKQTELLRTHLTPELTPQGTQPKKALTAEEARARAEMLVTGKAQEHTPAIIASNQATHQQQPPVPAQAFTAKADPDRPAKPAKEDGPAHSSTAPELLDAEKVDDAARAAPLEAQTITEAYKADIDTLQAGHEVQADEQRDPATWTKEERTAAREARIAELQAERASAALTNTHSTGGGRTM